MFAMTWSIDDDDWNEARRIRSKHPPQSVWDVTELGYYYLLPGDLQLSYGDSVLFPASLLKAWYERGGRQRSLGDGFAEVNGRRIPVTQGAGVYLLERAVQLPPLLGGYAEEGVLPPTTWISSDEQGVAIKLEYAAETVHISSSFTERGYDAPTLAVPVDEFIVGVREFLESFVGAIQERVPELLDWVSTKPLWPYRS